MFRRRKPGGNPPDSLSRLPRRGPASDRISGLAKKELALLTLQSLVYLPVLIFLTKSTPVVLLIVVVSGLVYVRSAPRLRLFNMWTVLLATCLLSAAWSIEPGTTLERSAKFGGFLILLGAAMHVVSRWSDEDRRYMIRVGVRAWWIAFAILLPLAIFGDDLKAGIRELFPGEETKIQMELWKPVSNNAVIILVLSAFPLLGASLRAGRKKAPFALALAGLFAAVLVSGSTSALLGLCAGLLVWFLYARWHEATRKALAVALPAAVLLMPLLVYPFASNPETIARNVPNFPNSFIHRMLIWDFTRDRIAERPLLGWGLETSRAIPGGTDLRPIHYVVPWADKPITHADQNLPLHPHNAALQIWLELGLLGVIVSMIALWRLLRTQLVRESDGPMAGFIVAAMAIYCVAFGLMQSWWLALLFLIWTAVKATETSDEHPR